MLALLLTASLGLALEVNASAESQGASCADAMTKIKLLVDKLVGENFGDKSRADQIATKIELGNRTDEILKYSCPKGAEADEKSGFWKKNPLTPNLEVNDPGRVKLPQGAEPQKGTAKP